VTIVAHCARVERAVLISSVSYSVCQARSSFFPLGPTDGPPNRLSGSTSLLHAHNLPIILLVLLHICRIQKARQPPMFLTASPISLMLTKAYKLVRPPVDEPITAFLTDPPKFFLALVRRVGQLCPIKFLTLRTHSKSLIFVCMYNRKAISITNCECVSVCVCV
jgi:hypothetical protein